MSYNVGDTICNCTLLQKCGNGAYGEVWLAMDAIGANVALKIIKNGGRYSERELAGLKNYKDCNHPNLLKIRYVEISDEQIICIMDAADDLNNGVREYQPDTLANRLRKYGRLDGKEITDMLDGLLSGLEELHKQGLVHRDIKPDNILWVNGRATLADVGLIAFEGAGSLVGTPGFLSPRVLEGNPAEASDDFYALGKVIYCALTGLAAKEYPSLPADMTISVDANLNRAVRESCSNPIHSTAEFRELLKNKKAVQNEQPSKKFSKFKLLLITLLFIAGGALFYLFTQPKAQKETKTVQLPQEQTEPVQIDSAAEKRLTELQNAEAVFQKELQETVLNIFEKSGWLNNNKILPFLVNYQLMSREEMQDLLFSSNGNPRLDPMNRMPQRTVRSVSQLEQILFSMLMDYHPDFDAAKVRERQRYWQKQGDIKAMLTTDPVMQAVALDAVIRKGINTVLQRGEFQDSEQAELVDLIAIRRALLDPEWGKMQYISKKILTQNR